MSETAARLDESYRSDPFGYLGMHDAGGLVVRAFVPWAESLGLLDRKDGTEIARFERKTDDGLFEARLGKRKRFDYRLRARSGDRMVDFEDPYRFGPVLGEVDLHLLGEGTHRRAFSRLGAHPITMDGVAGTGFAVWAPNASAVSVVGGFNDWDGRRHAMRKHPGAGVWDLFIPDVAAGSPYKYEIKGPDGTVLPLKADPVALQAQCARGGDLDL